MWVLLTAAVLGAAELLGRVGFPAPAMIVSLVVGAALALSGRLPAPLPQSLTTGVQGMLGVLMGSYLEVSLLRAIGWDLIPVLLVTVATLAFSVLVAIVFARFTGMDIATATLGLMAGGSAAVVACADELGADARRVAFMQYLRVGFVALSAPVVAAVLGDGDGSAEAIASRVTNPDLPAWMVVGRGDQVAGLSIAIVLCLVGTRVGRWLRLPNAALLGPMLLAMALTAAGVSHGYAPTHLFKQLLFVFIGFEVGTRFTRAVVVEMARLIPAMTAAVVALSGLVAALALGLGWFVELRPTDLYLATTPGGINAVLATAEDLTVHTPLITCVQSIRLIVMVLLLPLVVRVLRTRVPTSEVPGPDAAVAATLPEADVSDTALPEAALSARRG
ncbi:AbrB family transcriptional regulator [Nocardia sp. CDC159]|uniref:AbrB family transcriptional regulator n=1 Tax=Nocardia pulmonis TaxID=2951408 RepID=A0A9X2J1J6_9NOCA|nr:MULTISPECIES: AbrB family transcriptional regulator [Nocardia]MCM6777086.1 AbrB family transcriptional regulator [Nocardia pulmonis]MCM6789971.1 AbrB family transcriptional regulator [Nocardia sp. CDC159]